ncbi:hypothetical protein HK097_002450, partial [Rhizophlyctis rosea]
MSRPTSSLGNLLTDPYTPTPPPQTYALKRDATSPNPFPNRSTQNLRSALSRSAYDLTSSPSPPQPSSRSGSPDIATILDRVDRQIRTRLERAEDNLAKSGDGLVRAKLAVKSGSVAHLVDASSGGGGGGGGGSGSRMDLRDDSHSHPINGSNSPRSSSRLDHTSSLSRSDLSTKSKS